MAKKQDPFAISKEQRDEMQSRADDLNAKASDVETMVADFNAAMEEKWAKVEEAINDYHASRDEFNSYLSSVAEDMQGEWESRSEGWQQGDKGQAVSAFIDTINEAAEQVPELSLEKPDDLEVDFTDPDDVLNDLQDEPEEVE